MQVPWLFVPPSPTGGGLVDGSLFSLCTGVGFAGFGGVVAASAYVHAEVGRRLAQRWWFVEVYLYFCQSAQTSRACPRLSKASLDSRPQQESTLSLLARPPPKDCIKGS